MGMNDSLNHGFSLPSDQQAIRARCFHPSGRFVEFKREEIDQSIPERFEKIVLHYPDRIAVQTKNNTLTYFELNRAANRIAHTVLADRGEKDEPVVTLVDQDTDAMAALLGVFKTSKTCVPLDPAYHQVRAAQIVEESRAELILTSSKNLPLAHELARDACQVINLDHIGASVSVDNPGVSTSPDTVADILYTSGSTGRPKGVVQNHRNLLHDVMGFTNSFHICADDRLTLFASPSGGQGLKTVLNAFLNGAAVCIWNAKQEGLVNLARWVITQQISMFNAPPALLGSFMKTLTGEEEFPDLRLIILTGEPASRSCIEEFKQHFSTKCVLVNMFGALEAGQIGLYLIGKTTSIAGETVPVGYQTQDKEVLLVNEAGDNVTFNEIGEIAIRSRYLSPGYWRQPDLTEAKLKTDPDGGDKRLYFTGDLGLMLPDGCLMHKGRKDFRVKIRGYGVDIAEVENVLNSHAAVKDAVGVARHDESGETRFIAYFTVATQRAPTTSELREYLSKTLPDFMIPSVFVRLDAMPLTPNGKIDRRALPEPEKTRPELTISYMAPQSELETRFAGIWREVLCLDRVGIHDNFFDLGGHSLAASQVISRVIQTFQLELPVKALFDAPTVAEMAAIITQHQAKRASEAELPQMLREVEAMTEEEAQKQLAGERARSSSGDRNE
jgi:amino acid adenylation domain-containing protein